MLQQVQRKMASGQIKPGAAVLEKNLEVPGAGPVAYEGLGDLLQKLNDPLADQEAGQAYEKALVAENLPVDRIRVGLKLAQYYSNHGQDGRAQGELEALREFAPEDAKRFGVADGLMPTSTNVPPSAPPPPEAIHGNSPPSPPPPPKPATLPALPQQPPAPE